MNEENTVEHQATVDKGLKMKIKRKNITVKANEAKKSDELTQSDVEKETSCEEDINKSVDISDKTLEVKLSQCKTEDKDSISPRSAGKSNAGSETPAKSKKKKAETRASAGATTGENVEKKPGKQPKKSRINKSADAGNKLTGKAANQADITNQDDSDIQSGVDLKLTPTVTGKEKVKNKKESRKRSLQIALGDISQNELDTKISPLIPLVKEDIDAEVGKNGKTSMSEAELPSTGSSPSTDPYEFVAPYDDRFPVSVASHIPAKKFKNEKKVRWIGKAESAPVYELDELRTKDDLQTNSCRGIDRDRLFCCTGKFMVEMSPSAPFDHRDVGTDAFSVGVMTDPDCLGPCEPGTGVVLEGIVWSESNNGILVVNVTWRGKTYVGTLMDATRHHWGSPRFCDEVTSSEFEWRTPKCRRGSATPASEASEGGRRLRKGRRGGGACGGSKATSSARSSPVLAEANGRRRGSTRNGDLDLNSHIKSKSANSTSDEDSCVGKAESCAASANSILFECSNENCNKKYKHASGLLYHQSHAHKKSPPPGSESGDHIFNRSEEGMDITSDNSPEKRLEGNKSVVGGSCKNGKISDDSTLASLIVSESAASEGALTPCDAPLLSVKCSDSKTHSSRKAPSPMDGSAVPLADESSADKISSDVYFETKTGVTENECSKTVIKSQQDIKSIETQSIKSEIDAKMISSSSYASHSTIKLESSESVKCQGIGKDYKNGTISNDGSCKSSEKLISRSTDKHVEDKATKSEFSQSSESKQKIEPERQMPPSGFAKLDADYQRTMWLENMRAAQDFAARNAAAAAAAGHPPFPPGMGGNPFGGYPIDPAYHIHLMSTNADYREQYSRWMMTEHQRYRMSMENSVAEMKPVDMSSKPSGNSAAESQKNSVRDSKTSKPGSAQTSMSLNTSRDKISSSQNTSNKVTSDSGRLSSHHVDSSKNSRPQGHDTFPRSSDPKSQDSHNSSKSTEVNQRHGADAQKSKSSSNATPNSRPSLNSGKPFLYSPNSQNKMKSPINTPTSLPLPAFPPNLLPPGGYFPGMPPLGPPNTPESSYQALLGYANSAYLTSPLADERAKYLSQDLSVNKLPERAPSTSSASGKRPESRSESSRPQSVHRPSSTSGKDTLTPGGSDPGKKDDGRKDSTTDLSNPALTLRHLHTHHHTHVVGSPYPLYATYPGLMPNVPPAPPGLASTAFLPK